MDDHGDPTNHKSFQGSQHKAFHGLALAVLKSCDDATGSATLTASPDGLPNAEAKIQVAPVPDTPLHPPINHY